MKVLIVLAAVLTVCLAASVTYDFSDSDDCKSLKKAPTHTLLTKDDTAIVIFKAGKTKIDCYMKFNSFLTFGKPRLQARFDKVQKTIKDSTSRLTFYGNDDADASDLLVSVTKANPISKNLTIETEEGDDMTIYAKGISPGQYDIKMTISVIGANSAGMARWSFLTLAMGLIVAKFM